jgi:hypothetical protein
MSDLEIVIKNTDEIREIIEKVKFQTVHHGEVVLFTNGNDWYIPTLINNLLTSMEIHEPTHKIIVFCSDKSGYEKCKDLGFKYFEFVDIPDLEVSDLLSNSDASTKKYTRLCFVKTVLVKFILDLGYTPLYLDPDMAFVRPGIDDIISYLDKDNFVCAGQQIYINSNIMIAKPTEDNKSLFHLTVGDLNRILEAPDKNSDEDLLRPRLIDRKFGCLDLYKYPPGNWAVECKDIAIIIHSNCVIGLENKIELMKNCNAWFI